MVPVPFLRGLYHVCRHKVTKFAPAHAVVDIIMALPETVDISIQQHPVTFIRRFGYHIYLPHHAFVSLQYRGSALGYINIIYQGTRNTTDTICIRKSLYKGHAINKY